MSKSEQDISNLIDKVASKEILKIDNRFSWFRFRMKLFKYVIIPLPVFIGDAALTYLPLPEFV
ncbi:MAG: hypothetical protein B6241_06700 [Spirochaetaceae bacterium 4572_59]|nr:MAG: hypothetical protein B6241_06700 [Spirochaetaceae bacterium 4572_59]